MNHNPIDRKHLHLRHKLYLDNVSKAIVNVVNHPPKSTSNHQKKGARNHQSVWVVDDIAYEH
jgi:hypothetical protein